MTGIHGDPHSRGARLHLLAGAADLRCNKIPPENYSTVEVVSLYWHLVDAIWLFLMPLLYLAGAGIKG